MVEHTHLKVGVNEIKNKVISMSDLGKVLVIVGLIVAGVGLLLWSGVGKGWLGRLPGDIHYSRGNFTFYFPIVTSILLSLLLSLIFWLFRR